MLPQVYTDGPPTIPPPPLPVPPAPAPQDRPWSVVKYYAASGNEKECLESEAIVFETTDYTANDRDHEPCTPKPCFYGKNGYSTQTCDFDPKPPEDHDQHIEIKLWEDGVCRHRLKKVIHSKPNVCVAFKSDGAEFNSYMFTYDSKSLWNRRYSDSYCKNETKESVLLYNVSETWSCTYSKYWDSFYTVNVFNLDTEDSKSDNFVNLGAIVGGIIAVILFVVGVVGYFWWRHQKKNPTPKRNLTSASSLKPLKQDVEASKTMNEMTKSDITLNLENDDNISIFDMAKTSHLFDGMISTQVSRASTRTLANDDDVSNVAQILIDLKLPANPLTWTVDHTVQWLEHNSVSQESISLARHEEIDGVVLIELEPVKICKVLCISTVGRQVKLQIALEKIKRICTRNQWNNVTVRGEPDGIDDLPPQYDAK